jgi:hypothetical protein
VPDALGPDPTTRDLLADILRTFTERGHPGEPCLRSGWVRESTVNAWRAQLAAIEVLDPREPPPLPAEPPDGAICLGAGLDLWRRDDATGMKSSSMWWLNGNSHRYGEALDMGLTPRRRLVELPDLNDGAVLIRINTATDMGDGQCAGVPVVYAVLTALAEYIAERGQQ